MFHRDLQSNTHHTLWCRVKIKNWVCGFFSFFYFLFFIFYFYSRHTAHFLLVFLIHPSQNACPQVLNIISLTAISSRQIGHSVFPTCCSSGHGVTLRRSWCSNSLSCDNTNPSSNLGSGGGGGGIFSSTSLVGARAFQLGLSWGSNSNGPANACSPRRHGNVPELKSNTQRCPCLHLSHTYHLFPKSNIGLPYRPGRRRRSGTSSLTTSASVTLMYSGVP